MEVGEDEGLESDRWIMSNNEDIKIGPEIQASHIQEGQRELVRGAARSANTYPDNAA